MPCIRNSCNVFFYEVVNIAFIYLNGTDLTAAHFTKALLNLLITAAVIFVPFLNQAFSFATIPVTAYLTGIALALVVIPIVEIEKAFRRWILRKHA